jgi:hypothetical protein
VRVVLAVLALNQQRRFALDSGLSGLPTDAG